MWSMAHIALSLCIGKLIAIHEIDLTCTYIRTYVLYIHTYVCTVHVYPMWLVQVIYSTVVSLLCWLYLFMYVHAVLYLIINHIWLHLMASYCHVHRYVHCIVWIVHIHKSLYLLQGKINTARLQMSPSLCWEYINVASQCCCGHYTRDCVAPERSIHVI